MELLAQLYPGPSSRGSHPGERQVHVPRHFDYELAKARHPLGHGLIWIEFTTLILQMLLGLWFHNDDTRPLSLKPLSKGPTYTEILDMSVKSLRRLPIALSVAFCHPFIQ